MIGGALFSRASEDGVENKSIGAWSIGITEVDNLTNYYMDKVSDPVYDDPAMLAGLASGMKSGDWLYQNVLSGDEEDGLEEVDEELEP